MQLLLYKYYIIENTFLYNTLYHNFFENASLFFITSNKIINIKQIEGIKLSVLTKQLLVITAVGIESGKINSDKILQKTADNNADTNLEAINIFKGKAFLLSAITWIITHIPPKEHTAAAIGSNPKGCPESSEIAVISKRDLKRVTAFSENPRLCRISNIL